MTGCKNLISFFLFIFVLFFTSQGLAKYSSVVSVVKRVSPAIVNIKTEEYIAELTQRQPNVFNRLFSDEYEDEEDLYENIGSGVVIDPTGIVLTNEHLISKAIRIRVTFINGKEYEADVLGCDPEFDLAVLKIRSDGPFPYLKLKKRKDLMVGESVVVIGNPYGLSSSVSTGVISALGRNLKVEGRVFANLIQTDAAINPGNSGGALLDSEGNLIGIVTAVLGEGKGIGFAIPAYDIERMIANLIEAKKDKPIIGIFVEKLKEGPYNVLLVKKVIEKSPAHIYGLKKGDRIVEINRKKIKEGLKLKEITNMIREGKETLEIRIMRNNEDKRIVMDVKDIINFRPTMVDSSLLDIRVSDLSAYTRLKYRVKEKKGAIVCKVTKGGVGHSSGLRAGDLILKINNVPVESKEEFERLMLDGIKRNYLLYQILRNRMTHFVPLKLENLL
ncbi:MAG: trypsin-like peptidase domain-containing protein [Desulfobacterota bacterium]|nr:trypsin-like peptidase domain-containing protein [Thermodesulfobacteriota bacterium]MDW8002685.1 trypsin-like peptidase domain-containing protein [Deltaproteobacteria bacterium]